MTDEERQQVQNLINARIKILSERISRQDEEIQELGGQIISLTSALENREQTIEDLKGKLSEAESKAEKLSSLLKEVKPQNEPEKTKQPEKIVIHQERPNYLVSLLHQHFGFNNFRPGQEEVINAVISGRDVFCSMPDDFGKSVAYRLAALLMPGLTLVVTASDSELQNFSADSHSEILTGDLSPAKKREILRKIKSGTCKILYSDFEILTEPDITASLKGAEISAAFLIAEWGEGKFDPEKLSDYKNFISSLSTRRIVSGVFANSTSPTFRKILLKIADLHSPLKIVAGFSKPDVSFKIFNVEDRIETLKEILNHRKDSHGIIFCDSDETVSKLKEIFKDGNFTILPEKRYKDSYGKNINFIVHFDTPQSLGSYSQEITAIQSGECIILSSRKHLRLSERAVIEFCRDENPKKILLSYLGEDENFTGTKAESPEKIQADDEKILPEDFDFKTANEAQKEAITTTNGAILISAAPGTGKTYTLIQRTVFLIQKRKARPENIILTAFSEESACNLISGVEKELSERNIQVDAKNFYAGTFYEVCEKILREFSDYRDFRVVDEFENAVLIFNNAKKFDEVRDALKISGKWEFACGLRDYINRISENLIDPEELIRDNNSAVKALGNAMKIYDEILTENNSLSHSAILSLTYRLIRDNPEISDQLREKIRYIMIDDYQDSNFIQEQISFLIFEGSREKNICVTGDANENIHGDKGASAENILRFPEKFGKNECKIVKLILNYRSDPEIIKFFGGWLEDSGGKNKLKIEACRSQNSKYKSVTRLAGMNDSDEWHEKILAFLQTLKNSGIITNYNQAAFIFKSLKNSAAQDLLKFLENNNIKVYSPRSNSFFYRNEIYFAVGCFVSMFPSLMKSLQFSDSNSEHSVYYKNCLKYFSRFINRPPYENLKKWIIEKRTFHSNLDEASDYSYSDLLYHLVAFKPFSNALDVNINDSPKALKPAQNIAKFINLIRDCENFLEITKIRSKNIFRELDFMMNVFLRSAIESGVKNSDFSSNSVIFTSIQEAQGMQFPIVFVDSLFSTPENKKTLEILNYIRKNYARNFEAEFESYDEKNFSEFQRLFYTAFSRAENLLILTCSEDSKTPSKYFETLYNKLDDAEESEFQDHENSNAEKISEPKKILSFDEDILPYETCPTQYKFQRKLDFIPRTEISETQIQNLNSDDGSVILKSNCKINLERENYVIESHVDLISMKGGEIEISAFKNGSRPNRNINADKKRLESYTRQLNLLSCIAENSLGIEIKRTKIYFSDEKNDSPEIFFTYKKSDGESVINKIDRTAQKILNGDFDIKTSDSDVCRKCDFKFYCGRV